MPYCKICGTELPADSKYCPKCGTPVTTEENSPASVTYGAANMPKVKVAFWGERFVAWLIDIIIVGIIVGLLGLFSWFASGGVIWWSNWPSWVPFFNFNIGGVIYFLYWMLMDGAYGQSLGKMIMHLKVTRLDGRHIGMGNAAVESVGKAFILPLDVLLGWILYPKQRQRLFNYISETIVIREN